MSAWTRAPFDVACGYCGDLIRRGAPLYELTIARKKRCIACAGVPVPLHLPPLEERRAVPDRRQTREPVKEFARLADLMGDWKTKQSGETE